MKWGWPWTRLDRQGRHHLWTRHGATPPRLDRRRAHRRLLALSERPVVQELTQATSTPIHTGEEIYLRENFKDLIENQAVNVIGPDPEDVGGIAELKWIAEYANLHDILVAPHGVFDGLIGLAAHVQMAAALPQNYIAFEYPIAQPEWWSEIVEGLPDPIMQKGFIDVWDTPALGVRFNVQRLKRACVMRIVTSLTEPTCVHSVALLGTSRCATQSQSSISSLRAISRLTSRRVDGQKRLRIQAPRR